LAEFCKLSGKLKLCAYESDMKKDTVRCLISARLAISIVTRIRVRKLFE